MKTNLELDQFTGVQDRNRGSTTGEYCCDICKRPMSVPEQFTDDLICENPDTNKKEVNYKSGDIFRKRYRSHGTDAVGSSWECTHCITFHDDEATICGREALLREQIMKACNDLGTNYLAQLVNSQKYQLKIKGHDDRYPNLLNWGIEKNWIEIQENGTNTVFIINGPPADGRCMLCGRNAEELKVHGQDIVEHMRKTEWIIGGDVDVTHCICPHVAEGNRLIKNAARINGVGGITIWECPDCSQLKDGPFLKQCRKMNLG